MKRLLVLCAVTLQMASAADASDRRNGVQGGDHGGQSAVWRHGARHEWGVVRHYRCVVDRSAEDGVFLPIRRLSILTNRGRTLTTRRRRNASLRLHE
jgi:hypothetical protein